MNLKTNAAVVLLLSIAAATGVAVAAGKKPAPAPAAAEPAPVAVTVDQKTLRKLSMGVGEEVSDFTVTKQEEVQAGAMYTTEYTLLTRDGRKYKCEIMESSKFAKVMSMGMGSGGSSAMCTEFASKGAAARPAAASAGGTSKKASSPAASTSANQTTATAVTADAKTLKKISMGIGEEVSEFTVTAQEEVQAGAMYTTEYTVLTRDGRKYKCEIMESSKFAKVMSMGMGSGGSSAMCTDFTKGSKDKGKVNQASCNALLRAAGKCD